MIERQIIADRVIGVALIALGLMVAMSSVG